MASPARRTLLLCVHDTKASSQYVNSLIQLPRRTLALRQSQSRPWRASRSKHARYFSNSRPRRQEAAPSTQAAEQDEPTIDRTRSKLFKDADEAVADIKSGSIIFSAGFGLCGTAETIITAMHRRGPDSLNNLTAVSNNAGAAGAGGLSPLTQSGQITRCILSYLGNNKKLEQKYLDGRIAIELCPQGTLAERIRAGGSGIPAFYTPTGVRMYTLFSSFTKLVLLRTDIH
jgi:3-oxoacid CoA-transferase